MKPFQATVTAYPTDVLRFLASLLRLSFSLLARGWIFTATATTDIFVTHDDISTTKRRLQRSSHISAALEQQVTKEFFAENKAMFTEETVTRKSQISWEPRRRHDSTSSSQLGAPAVAAIP